MRMLTKGIAPSLFIFDPMFRSSSNGEVEAIETCKSTICSKKAVIVAAGCWSGSLMHNLIRESDIELDIPIEPRKVRFTSFHIKCSHFWMHDIILLYEYINLLSAKFLDLRRLPHILQDFETY